jgi:hypothetical protein
MANLDDLRDGQAPVTRIEEDGPRDSVARTTIRVRPVMTPKPSPRERTTSQ